MDGSNPVPFPGAYLPAETHGEAVDKALKQIDILRTWKPQRHAVDIHGTVRPSSIKMVVTINAGPSRFIWEPAQPQLPHGGQVWMQLEDTFRASLKSAVAYPDPRTALKHVDTVWSAAKRIADDAESRMRVLLIGLGERPPEPIEDTEFESAVLSLSHESADDNPASSSAVQSTLHALRAAHGNGLPVDQVELSTDSMGRIAVDWPRSNGKLRWVLDRNRLPWPGTSAQVYFRRGSELLQVRDVRHVEELLRFTRDELAGE